MVELVDTKDLKSLPFLGVPVQVRPRAPQLCEYFLFFFFLVSCSKDVKVPFANKDLTKTANVIIENEFVITYTLIKSISQKNDVCKMSLEIKNISKEEKRNSFSIEAFSFADKKFETFVVEKKSKPNEIVNTTVDFNGINCGDLRKINFYK